MKDYNDYVGLPFKDKGRQRSGIDCWGLFRLFYIEQLSIVLPSYLDSYVDTEHESVSRKIEEDKGKLFARVEEGAIGDGILVRMKGLPWHVGIVLPNKRMLHIECGIDSVIEKYKCMKWEHRIIGFYRHKSLL